MIGDVSSPQQQPDIQQLIQQQQAGKIHGHHRHGNPAQMFKKLSEEVGSDGKGITKDQLQAYQTKLQSEGKDSKMIDNLISNFDKIAGTDGKITTNDLQQAFKQRELGRKQHMPGPIPQDPDEVTKDQLQSPIDIRIGT